MNKYNPHIHRRRSIRLQNYDYSQEGLYFITICVQDMECLFGEIVDDGRGRIFSTLTQMGKIAEKCWLEIPQHYPKTVLHEHIVMPNHFHGILEITANGDNVGAEYFPPDDTGVENIRPLRTQCKSGTLGAIIRGFKIGTTKQTGFPVWQRNYHEHIIRNQKSYETILEYIINNPAKWRNDKFFRK